MRLFFHSSFDHLHMPTSTLRNTFMALACLAGLAPSAHAALTISSTRIVQASDKQSSSVVVANPSSRIYAAQSWVNTEADDNTTAVPLIATPALFRVDPGQEQTVQINRLPNDLPQDRESLFYFNLQEIPQVDDATQDNVLAIALRTRIKLFYRPSQLKGQPEQHLKDLKWSMDTIDGKLHLVVDNPSPYHYTFGRLELSAGGHTEALEARQMAAPLSKQAYPLKQLNTSGSTTLLFTTISDYGGTTPEQVVTVAPAGGR